MGADEIKINLDDKEVIVSKSDYVKAKTKDLKSFGYPSLTEDEVSSQLDKIIKGHKLNIIGMFMQSDIIID